MCSCGFLCVAYMLTVLKKRSPECRLFAWFLFGVHSQVYNFHQHNSLERKKKYFVIHFAFKHGFLKTENFSTYKITVMKMREQTLHGKKNSDTRELEISYLFSQALMFSLHSFFVEKKRKEKDREIK